MDKYCCFLHPQKEDYEEKKLNDLCPDCSLPFGFPLMEEYCPKNIGEFKVLQALSRGYYGTTYIGEKETALASKKQVLKVVPKLIYEFFEKDFLKESQEHYEAAQGSQHIVQIENIFEEEISFGEIKISCHVAILEYLKGNTLKAELTKDPSIPASRIGQIAIDLLNVMEVLKRKKLFHNDLHPGNIVIQELSSDQSRIGELDESIKAVVIDFGSIDGKTKSEDGKHISDLHHLANILIDLSQKILEQPQTINERDYRLASLLEERGRLLLPKVTSQRHFEFEQVIEQIRNAFNQVNSPWKATLSLKNHRDYINAQTLEPWFVPSLLVDDEDKWITEISNKGPQIITGMRGCGKTMLLRALQFHAQGMPKKSESSEETIDRLKKDAYIGLYVSCTRLLDKQGESERETHEPFTRLYVAYALESINAMRHLRELDSRIVNEKSFSLIASIVSEFVDGADLLKNCTDEYGLERDLKDILNSLSKRETKYTINANAAIAFPELADTIRQCASIWQNSYVFFLLDDVSTRYLNDNNIIRLVSTLLFQNEKCAFKFTTEAQTLRMVLHSPGNIEPARIGRDYNVFDLGHEVDEKVHSNKPEGIKFVENILFKRAQFQSGHPKNLKPSELLGDKNLTSIAESIGKPGKASDKKEIYSGITAIASVCVGDIGDVITLYEMILKKRKGQVPVSEKVQNECYLELSNSRLFDINRRDSRLYDFAESFANAAHHLLIQSYKTYKAHPQSRKRLRQYSSIFINITSGDIQKQYEQVRALIDDGIFNFSGGPEASRTNRQGVNPQQQFKLTYRKLYGVSKHIGLANADRFELSGEPLEEWLDNPKKGKVILTRNLKSKSDIKFEEETENSLPSSNKVTTSHQKSIFEVEEIPFEEDEDDRKELRELAKEKIPSIKVTPYEKWTRKKVACLISGLGFEDRTLESLKRILQFDPKKALLVRFIEEGKSKEIIRELNQRKVEYSEVTIDDAINDHEIFDCDGLIDVTGLPKAVVFNAVRNVLLKNKEANIVCTEAENHYPLNNDINKLLKKYQKDDQTQFLESLTQIIKGEKGPYKLVPLLPLNTENYSARRVLIAFSSPKHERLYSLLDDREYDKIHIIVPPANTPRNKLAKIAAEVALRRFNHAEINEFDSDNIKELVEYLSIKYQSYFVDQNYSFEIALTGSKVQAIACAVMCTILKVSQCWYVQPAEWDSNRFTKGTQNTMFYSFKLKNKTH